MSTAVYLAVLHDIRSKNDRDTRMCEEISRPRASLPGFYVACARQTVIHMSRDRVIGASSAIDAVCLVLPSLGVQPQGCPPERVFEQPTVSQEANVSGFA